MFVEAKRVNPAGTRLLKSFRNWISLQKNFSFVFTNVFMPRLEYQLLKHWKRSLWCKFAFNGNEMLPSQIIIVRSCEPAGKNSHRLPNWMTGNVRQATSSYTHRAWKCLINRPGQFLSISQLCDITLFRRFCLWAKVTYMRILLWLSRVSEMVGGHAQWWHGNKTRSCDLRRGTNTTRQCARRVE